jgi:hypothetical protein
MARIIFCWLFLILLYFFATGSLLSQMQLPVTIYPGSDNSFWLLHILNIPQLLLQHHWAALLFDVLLTSCCIICIFVPQQRLFTWITVVGVWLLYICYCTAAGKHYAQTGYLLVPVAFLAVKEAKFSLLWQLVRYWVCFLYVSAGIYKLYYGGFADGGTMSNIITQSNAGWLPFVQDGWQSSMVRYYAENPGFAQWFYRLAALVDLALLLGFFTKKADKWLLLGLLSFHVGNFLLLHISFVEQSLIFAPLLPWHKWANYFQSIKGND